MTLRSLVGSIQERCRFELDLANKSFLDSSWDRPEVRRFELVPCKDLGLMICPVRGYIVVTKVKSYSVAGEDSKVSLLATQLKPIVQFQACTASESFLLSSKCS